MHFSRVSILLALAATLPFTVALPAAEADVSSDKRDVLSSTAAKYWTLVFYESNTCNQAEGQSSYNEWNEPQPCQNILLLNMVTPTRFEWKPRGTWKLQLYKKMDCKGEVTEQGPDTKGVCQNVAGIWPKRSFKVVKA